MAELTYDWVAGKPKTVPMDQLPPKVPIKKRDKKCTSYIIVTLFVSVE